MLSLTRSPCVGRLLLLAYASRVVASDPFYADPLFDAAHDAEFVWHEGEQTWWLIYLQVSGSSILNELFDYYKFRKMYLC